MAQDYAASFYNSKEWEDCRNAFMMSKHYICERCGGLAKICHHKTYITPQNINNKEHLSGEICAEGLAFDSKGNLIKTQTPRLNES